MNALVKVDDLDAREEWDDEKSMPGSHATLINAVIARAVSDLFSEQTDATSRSEAYAFLTARTGAWAEWREHYCWLVDLDPNVLRERVMDILEGRRDLDRYQERGRGNLDAKYGREFLAQERAREEAARTNAKARAERDRERRKQENAALDEERRVFEQKLKAAEIETGIRPRHRRKVTSTKYLEANEVPLGHVLRLDESWEASTFCTFLNVLLPDKSSAMGRAVLAACSDQGFVLEHHNRFHFDALKQAAEFMGVAILFQGEDGNPVLHRSEAATARLRLQPPQPSA